MGVPAFFRWLSRKYPSVIADAVEISVQDDEGNVKPIDPSQPNPNGIEFDNLYLDMNGIIHPCTHPEDKAAPKNEDEMMVAIFEAIDRLLNIVRPRKILYMAVDGVAPRAKMNQQRSRRFRASKESSEKVLEIGKIRAKLESEGAILPPPKGDGTHFDSNCITPGTPFMDRLSKCLQYYAHHRLNSNPAWKKLKIILSDANVPGEGEHKVMDFIRKQRAQPNYDPNTVHCLCGADADLMMLGLATHEPNFYIIREEFKPNTDRPCDICGQIGHELKDCQGLEQNETVMKLFTAEVRYIFVRLAVLREYLRRELDMPGLPFEYDFERVVDDWVFMCFFVGNDFLPHLPSLEIREGAIDRLIGLYKKAVYKTRGYLTEDGQVALSRVQLIMTELGIVEDEIFKKRQQTEEMFRARNKAKRKRMRMAKARDHPSRMLQGQYAAMALGGQVAAVVNPRQEAYQQRVQSMQPSTSENEGERGIKRPHEEVDSDDEDPAVNDEVRLWEAGFKDRYYESKFDVSADNLAFRRRGCPSWNWYFPYHYAPFASDFIDIAAEPIVWDAGTKPFSPLEQLMSVFPAASKQHVPEPWGTLMFDPHSPIIDFYPEDFKIDLNGKKFAWQGVALLPFVDEKRLHKALATVYSELTDDEVRRNGRGDDRLFIGEACSSFSFIKGLYENRSNYDNEVSLNLDELSGRVLLASDAVSCGRSLPSPICGLEVIRDNQILCVRFRDAKYADGHLFSTKRLPLAKDPDPVLKPQNLPDEVHRNWKPQIGMVRATQVASLGMPGHRMLGHYANTGQSHYNAGPYSAVPPYTGGNYRSNYNPRHQYQNYQDHRRPYRHNEADSSNRRYQDDRNQRSHSLYAENRQKQRNSERSSNFSAPSSESQNSNNNTGIRRGRGFAVSYVANPDRISTPVNWPPDPNNGVRNRGYQQFNPSTRRGGPRPIGYHTRPPFDRSHR